MYGYFEVFPAKLETELRTLYVTDESDFDFPTGAYFFSEFYCANVSCDCQRVLIKVLHAPDPSSQPQEVATISYSWNDAPDAIWKKVIDENENPFLDPFHYQADFAADLMDFWYQMICFDQRYLERLKRHYAELRLFFASRDHADARPAVAVSAPTVDLDARKHAKRILKQRQENDRRRRRSK